MKKFFSFILSFCIVLSSAFLFSVCTENKQKGSNISVVTTIFPIYDFIKNIAEDKCEASFLLKPGEETHSYEPTPQDILKIKDCDVFIYIGGKSDSWVEGILSSIDISDKTVISLMDYVTVYEAEHINHSHGENEDGNSEHHDSIEYDEHIWTSPVNAIKMVEKISEAIISKDSDNRGFYTENTKDYISELKKLDSEFRDIVKSSQRKKIIVGDRFPFLYFAKEYGIEYYAAFPGCTAESEVSAATIAEIVSIVKDEKIPVIFQLNMSNGRVADSICAETGAEKNILYPCGNISKDEYQQGESYISLMEKNAEALKNALGYINH